MYYHHGWDFIAFAYLLLIKCLSDGRVSLPFVSHSSEDWNQRFNFVHISRFFRFLKLFLDFFKKISHLSTLFNQNVMVIFYEITFEYIFFLLVSNFKSKFRLSEIDRLYTDASFSIRYLVLILSFCYLLILMGSFFVIYNCDYRH